MANAGDVQSTFMLEPDVVPAFPLDAPPRIAIGERLGALAEVILCSGFPTQILILAAMGGAGMRLPTADG